MNRKIYIQRNNSGFTLVELIVSMAIFVTALSAISTIFMYYNRIQRTTEAVSDVQTDARFALEVIAQRIRRSSIYYSSSQYGGSISSNPQDVLVLQDSEENQTWFRRNTDASRGYIEMSENGSDWVNLTPPDVSVDILKFYISPTQDPFLSNPTTNIQPKVTVVMVTSSTSANTESLMPTYLQTTISSRQYLR